MDKGDRDFKYMNGIPVVSLRTRETGSFLRGNKYDCNSIDGE